MRLIAIVLVLSGACGVEPRTEPQDDTDTTHDDGTSPDGGTSSTRDGGVTGDGANLTPCEEAVFHSDLAWIQTNVFSDTCTTGCHTGSNSAAGLNLSAGVSRGQLVNLAARTQTGWIRVVPNDPGASLLMVEIGGEPGHALEGFMPWGLPRLCVEKVDAIRRWIAAVAQP